MDPFAILISLFGPFLIWPLEYWFPFPYIIEEIAKGFIVYISAKNLSFRDGIKVYLFSGFVFALTETVLYSININLFGQISLFFVRLGTSTILHSLTFAIIFWFYSKNKKLIWIGILIGMLLHFLYNRYIPIY